MKYMFSILHQEFKVIGHYKRSFCASIFFNINSLRRPFKIPNQIYQYSTHVSNFIILKFHSFHRYTCSECALNVSLSNGKIISSIAFISPDKINEKYDIPIKLIGPWYADCVTVSWGYLLQVLPSSSLTAKVLLGKERQL